MTTPPPQSGGGTSGLVIPPEIRETFGELLELILRSESMNDEERQYWINILPVMTPDQIGNLRQILSNERDQLAAIDRKYQEEIAQIGMEENAKRTQERRSEDRRKRRATEQDAERAEEAVAEDLLKKIESDGTSS